MKQKHFIDSHKGATPLFVLGLIAWFGAWQHPTAWLYLATHGSYGLLWVHKSYSFGDKQWEAPCSPAYAARIWIGLSLYWITPYLIVSRHIDAPAWAMGLAVGMYAIGVFYHFAADMQKHTHLEHRGGLLSGGLWARSRNPNYFGELLIYLSFGVLAAEWAWVSFLVLAIFFGIVWWPNMRKKDASLSRYPAFAEWKSRTGLILPKLRGPPRNAQ